MRAAAARPADARPPPFPWDAALHFGLGLLRLAPDAFWALSLRELMAMGGGSRAAAPMDRTALAALMRRWPDRR
ncbi:MAG: phage tail assembly chaperone [Rhizobiaceae bacterium]|nr:phage tail assembly chaperone [Rhizobiaceae bacterium]